MYYDKQLTTIVWMSHAHVVVRIMFTTKMMTEATIPCTSDFAFDASSKAL